MVQNLCVLVSIKQTDLLEFMMELDIYIVWLWTIWRYLQHNWISFQSNKQYHICFFSLLCKNQSWFLWLFTYRKKKLTLYNVIILIKSVLKKNKNHCYYNIFLEKCMPRKIYFYNSFHSIIMLRFGETNLIKEKFYAAKKPYKFGMLILTI